MTTPKRAAAQVPMAASSPAASTTTDKTAVAFSMTTKLIKFLLQRGLAVDGLFLTELPENQVAECKSLLKRLREDSLEHSQELLEHTKHAAVVGQLLLEFLKDLPEPLLTYANYDSFLMSLYIKEKAHRTKYCATLLNTTPPHHVALSTQLLTLLHRLVANQSVNSLNSELLAPLFAPHFLRPKKISPYMKEDEKLILSVMTSLIDDYDLLFSSEHTSGLVSSGSTKLRKISDSPYVTDLSQASLTGSSKLISHMKHLSSTGSGHKRSASSAHASAFANALENPKEGQRERDDDALTADDFSDDEVTPAHLNASNDTTNNVATR